MNVWHLLSNRWNSAITEYALSVARALECEGHRSFFTPLIGSPAERRALDLRLKTLPISKFSLAALPQLRAICRESRPDLVITYGGPETFLLRWISGLSGVRVVRFRGHSLSPKTFWTDVKQRLSLRHIDMVLTPSDQLALAMRERGLHSLVHSTTLGCDTQRFFRKPPKENPRRPELVIFGRFDPVKGHREFMAVFAHLLRYDQATYPKPILHIVGQSANASGADLRAAGESLGLRYGTDFRITEERIADVASMMSSATLGIVSSVGSEIICRVAEEFILCGTPVVTSDVGSLKEVFKDESFGATYSLAHVEHAADVLRTWIERGWHESEAEKVTRAREAKAYFSLEAMGRRLNHLLSLVLT